MMHTTTTTRIPPYLSRLYAVPQLSVLTDVALSVTEASNPTAVAARLSVVDPEGRRVRVLVTMVDLGLVAPPCGIRVAHRRTPPPLPLGQSSDNSAPSADVTVRRPPFRNGRLLFEARATLVRVGINPSRAHRQKEANFMVMLTDGQFARGDGGMMDTPQQVLVVVWCPRRDSLLFDVIVGAWCLRIKKKVVCVPPMRQNHLSRW
jgi:hypothetical protein